MVNLKILKLKNTGISLPFSIKRALPRRFLGRALMIIMIPLILLQVVVAVIFYERHWDTMTRHLSESLAGEIALLIDSTYSSITPPDAEPLTRQHLGFSMTYFDGRELPQNIISKKTSLYKEFSRAMMHKVGRPFLLDIKHKKYVKIYIKLPEGVLYIIAPHKRLFSSTTYIFVLWMVGTSLILFFVATIFMRNQVRPIKALAHAVDSFGKGQDVKEFKPSGALEIRQAAIAFNRMRDNILRQITQRTEMLAGVSHDLRTPLTRMKLQLSMMKDDAMAGELLSDVEDMEHMINGYLDFAKGEGAEKSKKINCVDILTEVISSQKKDGLKISLFLPRQKQNIFVSLKPQSIKRCLVNLIDNAYRYGGKNVAVTAYKDKTFLYIIVEDNGVGIPADKREDVFRPFFRLESSRNSATGGVGLGLAIVRDIIHAHGGKVSLDDAKLGGLKVSLTLPI